MAGAGHAKPIHGIDRIIKNHGGYKSQWVKMSSEDCTFADRTTTSSLLAKFGY